VIPTHPALYISGPFSDPDPIHGVAANITRASAAALEAARRGWAPFCPHKLFADFQHSDVPYDIWMDLCMRLLHASDAILMLEDWERSPGATREHAYAVEHGLLVYYQATDGVPTAVGRPRKEPEGLHG
jgi:hypothetical protein